MPILTFTVLAANPISDADCQRAIEWIEAMKTNPRGPYRGVLWYCEDGAVLAPKMSACVPHGGGVQHGVLSEQAEQLANLGLHVGTVLASLEPGDLVRDDGYRSRALVVETFLERKLDGWVLREAKTYRGFRQIEDEQVAAERLLSDLARREELFEGSRLLLTRLFWSLPIDVGGKAAEEIRELAGELGDADPSDFGSLRFKIHAVPDPGDVDAVARYAATHTGRLAESATRLATEMRRFYSPEGLRERLVSVRKRIRHPEVKKHLDAFLAVEPSDLGALFSAGAELVRATDAALVPGDSRQQGLDNQRLMYVAHVVETIWLSAEEIIRRRPMTRAEALRLSRDMLRSAASLGWLSDEEARRYATTVDRMLVGFTDQYDLGVRELLRVDEISAARLSAQLDAAVRRYRQVEPAATGAIDDQLRHSWLRPFAAILKRMIADLSRVRRGGWQIAGLPGLVDVELYGQVAGLATGELCAAGREACDGHTGIIVLGELPHALPRAAGVLLAAPWCEPTHLTRVARERGTVVACANEATLRAVRGLAGVDVALGVSREGRVLLGPVHELLAGTATADGSTAKRLGALVRSLDAHAELPELWLDMDGDLP